MHRFFALMGSLLIALGFNACKARTYTANTLPEKQLVFGSGGGFTGAVKEYTLLENGQLFERSGLQDTSVHVMPAIPRRKARKLFKQLEKMELGTIRKNQPGNIYSFLRYSDGETEVDMTWGKPGEPVDQGIKELYMALMEAAKNAER